MKDIVLSSGWTISSIFMICAVLYLFFVKKKQNSYSNRVYNFMLIFVIVAIILELLSTCTISIKEKIPVLNEIVCRAYVLSVAVWTFTTFEHMAYYDKRIPKKPLRIFECILAIICILVCIFVPIEYTNKVPYAIKGPLTNIILLYITIGSICEALLLAFKVIILKDSSILPYITTAIFLAILTAFQILSDDYMNVMSVFLTFVAVYQFYNTESQDSALLENYQVIKAQSDAKNKERDEFISSLSRKIRTPMSNIVGYSNLIMLDKENLNMDAIKKDGYEINKEAMSLLSIINNILDLSRFEAGKEVLEEKDYSFEKLVLDVNNDLVNTHKDVKLSYKIMKEFPNDLYGDSLKIEKLIQLICEYIIKDRINRSLTLEISYKYLTEQSIEIKIVFNLINVSVEDSLRQEKLELDMQIIDAYNAVLGSEFSCDLDVDNNKVCTLIINQTVNGTKKVENIIEKISASSNKETEDTKDYKDKTILIVDDSQMNINIAKRLFVKYGFTIEEAISGNDCIKMVQEKKYDIVFLDDMMPGLSGVQTLGELKKIGLELPPVVALTANSYDGLKEEYVKNGFTDYLAKPIDPNKLSKLINDLLGKGGEVK